MTVPELIPIVHEPGYRTDTIGRFARGQFFGHVTGERDGPGCWAVLHKFKPDGSHIHSAIELAPGVLEAEARLQEWLDHLPRRVYGDIAIAPFEERRHGEVFGLVLKSRGEYPPGEEQFDSAEFYPCDLGFGAPWDGLYST